LQYHRYPCPGSSRTRAVNRLYSRGATLQRAGTHRTRTQSGIEPSQRGLLVRIRPVRRPRSILSPLHAVLPPQTSAVRRKMSRSAGARAVTWPCKPPTANLRISPFPPHHQACYRLIGAHIHNTRYLYEPFLDPASCHAVTALYWTSASTPRRRARCQVCRSAVFT
jgi:hypothetical protein